MTMRARESLFQHAIWVLENHFPEMDYDDGATGECAHHECGSVADMELHQADLIAEWAPTTPPSEPIIVNIHTTPPA